MDCGPSCLVMIAKYYGKDFSLPFLRESSYITKNGVSLLGISQAAEKIGFETVSAKLTLEKLKEFDIPLPCILHWTKAHFVVLYKIKKNSFDNKYYYYLADPAHGHVRLVEDDFLKGWLVDKKGIALFLSPTANFYSQDGVVEKTNFSYLLKYVKPFKRKIIGVITTLFLGSILSLIFPFLTQYLVDDGINLKNINFIVIILLAQLFVFFGHTTIEVIRNRIFLLIGSRLNINIIEDFLGKLMLMPLKFFEAKRIGDLTQRIQDHKRIEVFLTSQSVLTLFSLINFSVFFIVLAYYDWFVLIIYLLTTSISILYVLYFQKKRKAMDYKRFDLLAENQSSMYEIITGMQELKLNSFEDYKREQWKDIQERLFKMNIKVLNLDQFQLSGYSFLNNFKNIFITFIVALNVVKGDLTLGAMFSISYIIGEMNSPIDQLITFFRSFQDAKLSFSRLNEIHNHKTEVTKDTLIKEKINKVIIFKNVSFQYEGPKSPFVLRNINLEIPKNKITAIVGTSGSGKTTLLKLLLKYYEPVKGNIYVDKVNLKNLSLEQWRNNYGVVMQDGFIFSETIERNIGTSDEQIDSSKLEKASRISNLKDVVDKMALGYKAKIGSSGLGISGGQKQRILIARAVYKDPSYLFFDEATSSLDAENEKIIMDNLNEFFVDRTVIIVAHRLSTVKNADQIIVLKDGNIVEIGDHISLVKRKSEYYNLIKNQLELGN